MPSAKLTISQVRALQPREKPYKVFDGEGLFLYVTPAGGKYWRLQYRGPDRKQKTHSIGRFPEVGLADARRATAEFRVSPRTAKGGITLAKASETYWAGRKDLSVRYVLNATSAIERHLVPILGSRPIGSITRAELLEALNVMDARGLHVYVRKTRMWISQVFEWAIEQGYATENPAGAIRPQRAFGKRPVKHHAWVPLRDLPELLQRLALEPRTDGVLATWLLAFTWVRTVELRLAKWDEFEGGVWKIPADRMKRRLEHWVPLSTQAQAILEEVRARRRSEYLFPNGRTHLRPMSENAILATLARLGYKNEQTGHGFRSQGSTWANERGFNPDAIEYQLAHRPENEVRAAYNHAKYWEQRRSLLQAWGDWVESQSRLSQASPASTTPISG